MQVLIHENGFSPSYLSKTDENLYIPKMMRIRCLYIPPSSQVCDSRSKVTVYEHWTTRVPQLHTLLVIKALVKSFKLS